MKSPSTWGEWIEIFKDNQVEITFRKSPSTWGEWIEILYCSCVIFLWDVSLHLGGVD